MKPPYPCNHRLGGGDSTYNRSPDGPSSLSGDNPRTQYHSDIGVEDSVTDHTRRGDSELYRRHPRRGEHNKLGVRFDGEQGSGGAADGSYRSGG